MLRFFSIIIFHLMLNTLFSHVIVGGREKHVANQSFVESNKVKIAIATSSASIKFFFYVIVIQRTIYFYKVDLFCIIDYDEPCKTTQKVNKEINT